MDNNLSCLKMISCCKKTCHGGVHFTAMTGWIAALIFLVLIILPTPVIAATIPEPQPALYVLDQAEVMSSQTESMIINTSQELARQTKAQVAVVTLKTLDDQSREDVALGILRKWQLGDKQLNNGVVILVVPSENKARVEVGYGLEGALPDSKTGRIQDDYMLPAFRQGNYDLGLANGYKAVVNEVAKEYDVTINSLSGTQKAPAETKDKQKTPAWGKILGAIGLVLLLWLDNRFFNGFFFGLILGMLFRGGGRGGGGFGGGNFGGGGSGGGGGSSRDW